MKRLFVVGALCGMMISNYSNGMDGAQGTLINHMKVLPEELLQKIFAACSNKHEVVLVCKTMFAIGKFFKVNPFQYLTEKNLSTLHITGDRCRELLPQIFPDLFSTDKEKECRRVKIELLSRALTSDPKHEVTRVRLYRLLLDGTTHQEFDLLDQLFATDDDLISHLIKTRRDYCGLDPQIIEILRKYTCDVDIETFRAMFLKYAEQSSHKEEVLLLIKKISKFLAGHTSRSEQENRFLKKVQSYSSEQLYYTYYDQNEKVTVPDEELAIIKNNILEMDALYGYAQRLLNLHDILIQGDSQALIKLLENESVLFANEQEKLMGYKLITSGVIQQFCSLGVVTKLLEKLKNIDLSQEGDEEAPVNDMLLFFTLFPQKKGVARRLDIAQLVVEHGADPNYFHFHQVEDYTRCYMMYNQDIHALDILIKAGLTIDDYDVTDDFILNDENEDDNYVSPLMYLLGAGRDGKFIVFAEFLQRFIDTLRPNVFECHQKFGDIVFVAQQYNPPRIVDIILKARYSSAFTAYPQNERVAHLQSQFYTIFINEKNGEISLSKELSDDSVPCQVTPLMYAVYTSRPWLVQRLLEFGAQPFEDNILDIAQQHGNQEIVQLLQQARRTHHED